MWVLRLADPFSSADSLPPVFTPSRAALLDACVTWMSQCGSLPAAGVVTTSSFLSRLDVTTSPIGPVAEVDHPSPVDVLVRLVANAAHQLYNTALMEAGSELAESSTVSELSLYVTRHSLSGTPS